MANTPVKPAPTVLSSANHAATTVAASQPRDRRTGSAATRGKARKRAAVYVLKTRGGSTGSARLTNATKTYVRCGYSRNGT